MRIKKKNQSGEIKKGRLKPLTHCKCLGILFLEFDFIQFDSRPLKVCLIIPAGILAYRSENV
jgi:hypothetical protein